MTSIPSMTTRSPPRSSTHPPERRRHRTSSGAVPVCRASAATARYMAPVSSRSTPSRWATADETVDLPAPAGPSMATSSGRGASEPRGQARQVLGEGRVAGRDRPEPGEEAALARTGRQRGDGRRHRHPVVAPAVEASAEQWAAATPVTESVSPSTVARAPNASTMSATAANRSTSLTRSSPTSEKTVVPSATAAATARTGISSSDGISLRPHLGGAQRARHGPDGGGAGLAGEERDRCAHPLEDRDVPQPGRAAVDPRHLHRAPGHDAPGHHEEGRCRGVAGHGALHGRRDDARTAHDPTLAPRLDRDVGSRLGQHLLGVRAGGHGLAHDGRAAGRQSRQEDGRLDLGAGHLGRPVDAMQRAALHTQRRLAAWPLTRDRGAHEVEGLGHPVHGPGRERLVADQLGLPVEPGHQARQQAHGRSRIAAVEWRGGLVQSSPAAMDDDRPVVVTLHAGPHRLHRGQGGGDVGAVGEPVDDRRALGQGAEQDGAVRDRLLTRCPHRSAARNAAVDDERARRRHERCSARQRYPRDSTATASVSASAPSTTRMRTPRGPSAEWAISMS